MYNGVYSRHEVLWIGYKLEETQVDNTQQIPLETGHRYSLAVLPLFLSAFSLRVVLKLYCDVLTVFRLISPVLNRRQFSDVSEKILFIFSERKFAPSVHNISNGLAFFRFWLLVGTHLEHHYLSRDWCLPPRDLYKGFVGVIDIGDRSAHKSGYVRGVRSNLKALLSFMMVSYVFLCRNKTKSYQGSILLCENNYRPFRM